MSSAVHRPSSAVHLWSLLIVALFGYTAVVTARDYFGVWANEPAVRLHYETALVEAVRYLNEHGRGPAAISSGTPNRFHSPATAFLTLTNPDVTLRWFDGRAALLLPQVGPGHLLFVGDALHPALAAYVDLGAPTTTLPLRPNDWIRPVTIYTLAEPAPAAAFRPIFTPPPTTNQQANFGDTAVLLGYDLAATSLARGAEARLVTLWQAQRPVDDLLLFVHLSDGDGRPLAQSDRLDAPSAFWQPGDRFIQLHQFAIPGDISPGDYSLIIGLYNPHNNQRLPLYEDNGGDHLPLTTLIITP